MKYSCRILFLVFLLVLMVTPSTQISPPGQGNPNLLKMHGILMSMAWLVFASIAIIIARYYRDPVPEQNVCGKALWFQMHRFFNTMCVLCTLVGVILIFMYEAGYMTLSDKYDVVKNKVHPPMGIIIVLLTIINPIMALFRPAPDSPRRVIYNWAHWALGTIVHVMAVLNIFIGLSLPMGAWISYKWMRNFLIAFVVFHVLVEIILQVQRCRRAGYRYDELPGRPTGKTLQSAQLQEPIQPEGEFFRRAVVMTYVVVTLLFGFCFTIAIAVHPVSS